MIKTCKKFILLHLSRYRDSDNIKLNHLSRMGKDMRNYYLRSPERLSIRSISRDWDEEDEYPFDPAFISLQYSKKRGTITRGMLYSNIAHYSSLKQIADDLFHSFIRHKSKSNIVQISIWNH